MAKNITVTATANANGQQQQQANKPKKKAGGCGSFVLLVIAVLALVGVWSAFGSGGGTGSLPTGTPGRTTARSSPANAAGGAAQATSAGTASPANPATKSRDTTAPTSKRTGWAAAQTGDVVTREDFLQMADSNRTLNLSRHAITLIGKAQEKGEPPTFGNTNLFWSGSTLVIRGVSRLTIRGGSQAGGLFTVPRGSPVLCFVGCSNITIENLAAGHERGADAPVFVFDNCRNVTIKNAELRGSGGALYAKDSDITLLGCTIEGCEDAGCTHAVVSAEQGSRVALENCTFRSNKACAMFGYQDGAVVTVTRCGFFGNAAALDPQGEIRFDGGCVFEGNDFSFAGRPRLGDYVYFG